jgi:hypothetical protein
MARIRRLAAALNVTGKNGKGIASGIVIGNLLRVRTERCLVLLGLMVNTPLGWFWAFDLDVEKGK